MAITSDLIFCLLSCTNKTQKVSRQSIHRPVDVSAETARFGGARGERSSAMLSCPRFSHRQRPGSTGRGHATWGLNGPALMNSVLALSRLLSWAERFLNIVRSSSPLSNEAPGLNRIHSGHSNNCHGHDLTNMGNQLPVVQDAFFVPPPLPPNTAISFLGSAFDKS